MTYRDHIKRHDFVMLFDVRNGNPNGDPDAGNLPRVNAQTMHGLVTDVALKRKVRDYVQLWHNMPIFIQSQHALNKLIAEAFRDAGFEQPKVAVDDEQLREWFADHDLELFDFDGETVSYNGGSFKANDISKALAQAIEDVGETDNSIKSKVRSLAKSLSNSGKQQKIGPREEDAARKVMCRTYYDIRMFGAVLSTGLNAGQVRGPVQLTFAESIDEIAPQIHGITRNAITRAADRQRKETEMARKPTVSYGLYRAHGFYSPKLAEQTGVSDDDIGLLWEALINMLDHDRAAARGQMAMREVCIFTHDNPLGNAHAHELFSRVRVTHKEGVDQAQEFEDYSIIVDDSDLPDGITVTRIRSISDLRRIASA